MLTYIQYTHMGTVCLACQTPTYDPKALETYSNDSKTLQAAPERSQTFPNYLSDYAYLQTIPHHTMGICLPYHHTHHKNHTYQIHLATCIKSCMCSSFRPAPSHEAYVFHARSTSGFCIRQLRLEKSKTQSLGHSRLWGHGAFLLLGGGVFQPFPNAPKQFPIMLKQNLENELSQPMKQVT